MTEDAKPYLKLRYCKQDIVVTLPERFNGLPAEQMQILCTEEATVVVVHPECKPVEIDMLTGETTDLEFEDGQNLIRPEKEGIYGRRIH